MSTTISIRLTKEQRDWLKEKSRRTGVPVGQLVRDSIDSNRTAEKRPAWMKLAGSVKGLPPDLSSRKGFSRS